MTKKLDPITPKPPERAKDLELSKNCHEERRQRLYHQGVIDEADFSKHEERVLATLSKAEREALRGREEIAKIDRALGLTMIEPKRPPRLPVWVNSDPREVTTRGTVVVCAPMGEVFRAEVETKHAYCVFLRNRGPDKLELIGEDDKWPLEFFWLYGPRGW